MDHMGKFCFRFQISYALYNWLLATCSWHDSANYLTLNL